MERTIAVAGAGIFGVWQALILARAGHRVDLYDPCPTPFANTASQHAGAMIAPFCEAEAADPLVRDYGLAAARLWKEIYPGLVPNGSLVVASARDMGELKRFGRMTVGYESVTGDRMAALEPDLAARFQQGLYFRDEAHMTTPTALRELLNLAMAAGAHAHFGVGIENAPENAHEIIVDCRGLAARDRLPNLRGVRGERLVIRTADVTLSRPVRLLHPRHPLYVVPWTEHRFLVGATVIESDDSSVMTVRSALELLGLAYALHPAFAEAEIIDMDTGVRPAFPDNVPRVIAEDAGSRIHVNGAYRHGFLLGPIMATIVRDHLAGKLPAHPLLLQR
ncbi:MAG: FAD-dependent oxidoreductase [Hyphomicrobiaceae bacterium]|nr:FAD-dependent oxidoreductase [Hyphomicrobiaceae bacterium]